MTSFSVLIPARDEEPTIAQVVHACLRLDGAAQVLVVSEGSIDGTADAARQAGATVIVGPSSRGKGHAIKRGLEAVSEDIVVLIDGDGQDDPEEIPLLLAAIDSGVGMVIGSRFLGRWESGAITGRNLLGTRFLTAVLNILYRSHVTDPIAGFRAVRRGVLQTFPLSSNGYQVEVEMVLRVLSAGALIAEVPATRRPRVAGRSRLRSVRDGIAILRVILTERARFAARRL